MMVHDEPGRARQGPARARKSAIPLPVVSPKGSLIPAYTVWVPTDTASHLPCSLNLFRGFEALPCPTVSETKPQGCFLRNPRFTGSLQLIAGRTLCLGHRLILHSARPTFPK